MRRENLECVTQQSGSLTIIHRICDWDFLVWFLCEVTGMSSFVPGAVSGISPYIKYYEGLSYDREDLHRMHLRARRATQSHEYTLQLDFTAFHR